MTISSHFHLNLPHGWEDQTVYTLKGPHDSGVQHMVILVVDRAPNCSSVAAYGEDRINTLEMTLQGMEVLKQEQQVLPDGTDAYECVYKWVSVDNDVRYMRTVYLLIDGAGYTFSGNFSKKTLHTVGNDMDAIVHSLVSSVSSRNVEAD